MRNTSDPGNWAHELTHQVNSMFRHAATVKYGREGNGCYIVGGYALTLPEPKLTLADIARQVPPSWRDRTYQTYLVSQRRWWNRQPLYVLDEAAAAHNGLLYQVTVRRMDSERERLARSWINLTKVLVVAVGKNDPNYSHLPQLKTFVSWYGARVKLMADRHSHQAR